MTIRARRIIMFGFIAVFLILAPTLIFYASGYRLDLKRGKILKTGSLMLEAKDIKKANLYINNQLYEKPFDEKIFVYNLLPGEYDVRLEKEGFHPWEKKITINSSLTTFAKDVILFKNNIPLQIIEGEIENFHLSPDQQKLIYLLKTAEFSEFYFYNWDSKESQLLYRLPLSETPIAISWAPSSKKILLRNGADFIVLDINNLKNTQDLNDIAKMEISNASWDLESDNLINLTDKKTIYQIDLIAKLAKELYSNEDRSINPVFFIEKNDIFYIQIEENKNILYKHNLNFQTTKKILELNKSQNYKFIPSTNNFLSILDLDISKLYLVQKVSSDIQIDITANDEVKEFDAIDATWDQNEKQLLIYNDFEIFTFNADTKQTEFINRYGQIIRKALWYPNLSYVLTLFENKIEITDLALINGTRNTTKIVEFDKLVNFYLDAKGKYLFFNGTIGKQNGIYSLELR